MKDLLQLTNVYSEPLHPYFPLLSLHTYPPKSGKNLFDMLIENFQNMKYQKPITKNKNKTKQNNEPPINSQTQNQGKLTNCRPLYLNETYKGNKRGLKIRPAQLIRDN